MLNAIIQFIIDILPYLTIPDDDTTFLSFLSVHMLIIVFGVIAAAFLLKSIGLFLMCKYNKINLRFLAFVPFVNYVLIGKLVGDVNVFGFKLKNIGLLLAINLPIVFGLYCYLDILTAFDEFYLLVTTNTVSEVTYTATPLINLLFIFHEVFGFVILALLIWLSVSFVSIYNRRKMLVLSLLLLLTLLVSEFWLLFNIVFGIMLIVHRKKVPMTLEEFLLRQEEIKRAIEQQYNGNMRGYYENNNDDPFSEYLPLNKENGLSQDVFSDFKPAIDYTERNQELKSKTRDENSEKNNLDDDMFS